MQIRTERGKQPTYVDDRTVTRPKTKDPNEGKPNPTQRVTGVEREEENVKDAQEAETAVRKKAAKKTARKAESNG